MRPRSSLLRLEQLETRIVPTVYPVGPGEPYAALHEVLWDQVGPGDRVLVYWQETPYHDKLALNMRGDPNRPVQIVGIPNAKGQLPIIDGNGAIENPQARYWSDGVAKQGVLTVTPRGDEGPDYEAGYIDIMNLEIMNGKRESSYYNADGAISWYYNGAAAVALYRAEGVRIINCRIHDNENGIFGKSYGYDAGDLHDVLVDHDTVYHNGVAGSYSYHNSYIEGAGTVYQFNWYGPLVDWSAGAGIKDRGAGTIVRYNWVEGGSHLLDLVDPADGADSLTQDPRFGTEYVYGNVLRDPLWADTVTMVHFGFDEDSANRQRVLYFYDNTVINENDSSTPDGRYRTIVFKAAECTIYAENNIFAGISPDPDHWSGYFYLVTDDYNSPTLVLGVNWGSDWLQGSYGSAQVKGMQNLLTGGDPGFVDGVGRDYRLTADSPCVNSGNSGGPDTGFTPLPVEYQYSYKTGDFVQRDSTNNLGAIE